MTRMFTLRGQKGKNQPSEPEISMEYIYRSEILYGAGKNILLGVKKMCYVVAGTLELKRKREQRILRI
jgi:hypothetical protein